MAYLSWGYQIYPTPLEGLAMAAFTTNTHAHAARAPRPTVFERFDAFFTGIARARTCAREYAHLAQLNDAQLAARGLTRQELVHHVARAYL